MRSWTWITDLKNLTIGSFVKTDPADILALKESADLIYDWTRRETFERCPKEYDFSYNEMLRPTKENISLEFGKRFHRSVELKDAESAWEGFREEAPSKYDFKTKAKGIALSKLYIEVCLPRDNVEFELISSELPFAFEQTIAGQKVVFNGVIDELRRERETGLYFVKEIKTTSSWKGEEDYFAPFELGHQISHYLAAMKLMFERDAEQRVGGVIIDVVKVTRKLTDESDFISRRFDIEDIKLTGADISSVREVLANESEDRWPQKTSACRRYGSLCPFFKLCRYGDSEDTRRNSGLVRKDSLPRT